MALAIATNNAALRAAASASSVNRDMETSMARLSSGKRINSASDDAAGVAISSRLTSNIRGTDQAIRNALDGQALIDTAEGAHKEIETSCSECVRLLYKPQMTLITLKTEPISKLKWTPCQKRSIGSLELRLGPALRCWMQKVQSSTFTSVQVYPSKIK